MNISRKQLVVPNNNNNNNGALRNKVTVATYNILADCHVLTTRYEDFHYVTDDHLLKNDEVNSKRHSLLVKELENLDSDVLLLQEVEDWYSPILDDQLKKFGYEYTFFQKAGVPEGSALCYKKSKFKCIDTFKVLIHDEVTALCMKENVPEIAMNQMAEPTVCIISALQDLTSGKVIIFATIHIIYDEFSEPAIQCLQACLACQKIESIREKVSLKLGIDVKEIAVVFGGDFNGLPDHMNIAAMKNGSLNESQMKRLEMLTYNVVDRKAEPMEFYETCHVSKYLPKYLKNPLKLTSAYAEANGGKEPFMTSSNGTIIGCLDYIFHSSDLKLVSVLDINESSMKDGSFSSEGGPSEEYASDHLPLVAEFAY